MGHGFDYQSGRYWAHRSTQPSIPPDWYQPSPAGVKVGVLAYVGLQVKLRDAILR